MDDLDRLADRLVANIRDGYPHLRDRTFHLGDVAEHLVPYRLNRRELGFDSVRQYELALMRLAAGERGYVRLDAAVQDAFRRALAAPEPDAALLRDHTRATVALSTAPPAHSADGAAAPTVHAASDPSSVPAASVPAASVPAASVPAASHPVGTTTTVPSDIGLSSVAPPSGPTEIGGPCRYCTRPLPEGRAVTFCPSCGQNVTVRHCPACSTELDLGWRYCITCGRMMDEGDAAR